MKPVYTIHNNVGRNIDTCACPWIGPLYRYTALLDTLTRTHDQQALGYIEFMYYAVNNIHFQKISHIKSSAGDYVINIHNAFDLQIRSDHQPLCWQVNLTFILLTIILFLLRISRLSIGRAYYPSFCA